MITYLFTAAGCHRIGPRVASPERRCGVRRHVWLLRHAKSVWDDPSLDDHD
jgi:hypothetical protein